MHAKTQPDPQLPLGRGAAPQRRNRRFRRRICLRSLTLLFLVSGVAGLAGPAVVAGAQEAGDTRGQVPVVDVVQVSGLIDPVLVDLVGDAVGRAEDEGVEALILQVDSAGSVVDQAELDALSLRFGRTEVPIVVWVGDSGARALGGAAELALAADITAMAPGTELGKVPSGIRGDVPAEITDTTVGPEAAFDSGLADLTQEDAAVLRNLIAAIDGREVKGRMLDTVEIIEVEGAADQISPVVQTRLSRLPLGSQLLHTAASPSVAFLLLAVGLSLLVFEFFTAGVGIAGLVGAGSLVLSAYGLAVLPTNPLGLALCLVGMFGFAVDVQTGVPRVWTVVGTLVFAIGAVVLFDDGIRAGWLALVGGVVGVVLLMLAGLPATVRSRFSTPTIGRESIVGEVGEATSVIAPNGVVRLRDALWRARTNRATPIALGDPVRVVAIEGTVLEVEPESGGARDYRERRTEV